MSESGGVDSVLSCVLWPPFCGRDLVMTENELNQVCEEWQLDAGQLARVLCPHISKMSEYASGVTCIPFTVAMHIEALQLLPDKTSQALIAQRVNHRAHSKLPAES